MSERWLLLETSGRAGRIGLAVGDEVREAALDPTRRHNRDLAPTVQGLLNAEGMTAKELTGVMVSIGPGSYTGLRVGAMSAKALAYATGCRLVPVPTFAIIAAQSPIDCVLVEVIGDALQGQAYVQRFQRGADGAWQTTEDLHIEPAAARLGRLTPEVWLSGPGITTFEKFISPEQKCVDTADRVPGLVALLNVGRRCPSLSREEIFRLEPLYLRGSSAEEKVLSR